MCVCVVCVCVCVRVRVRVCVCVYNAVALITLFKRGDLLKYFLNVFTY